MIPSDHFVRFYNEIFKFLDQRGGLQDFYNEISRHQEKHCLNDFIREGLRGVYNYYLKIIKEENCDCINEFESEHCLILKMNKCPSLSKAVNNDAGASRKYCLHCPGWTMPLYAKAGLYQIYDIMGLDNPQCCEWILDDLAEARQKYIELKKSDPSRELLKNFD